MTRVYPLELTEKKQKEGEGNKDNEEIEDDVGVEDISCLSHRFPNSVGLGEPNV